MTSRYPWLDGKYSGNGWCAVCRYELQCKTWWHDGDRVCTTCYERATGSPPPRPKTADDLQE